MYINLPSKNHYRRPASYASKGYHSRRMAVDFAVPLITNVKNAKLLAEALVRKLPLDVSNVDAKSSHLTHTFPGLINIGAFVPGLSVPGSQDSIASTAASLSGGFNTVIFSPVGANGGIVDHQSLEQARSNISGHGHCSYAFTICATAANVGLMDDELQAEVKALFVPTSTSLSVIASHFSAWSPEKVILTDAKGSSLASILLLASLHGRTLHVTDVRTLEDLLLISLSKAKQLKVTCDISVYSLFFTAEQFPGVQVLPTAEVQKVLWQKLDVIDAFSVGANPYLLASTLGEPASVCSGIGETLPLLLTAVSEHKLTLDDVRRRLYDNPMKIFGISDQHATSIEVVIGRRVKYNMHPSCWSPVLQVSGATHRVVINGQTAFLDGSLFSIQNGRDISGSVVAHAAPATTNKDDHAILPPITSVVAQSSTPHDQYDLVSHVLHIRPHPAFHRRHILSVKQFSRKDIYDLFAIANEMRFQVERNGGVDILKGKVLCTIFYEPSTRTSSSFDAAMKRCGGQVVQIAAETSSVQKGETLEDTIRTLACYGDAVVIRHPVVGSAQEAAKCSPIPVINAGDGIGEHPTQALLDVYTIRSELGTVNGRTITLLGDLKNGRTVHSLVSLLCLYSVRLNFVAPTLLAMPSNVVSAARKAGIPVTICESLDEVLADTDVLYVTRVQKERFQSEAEWSLVKDAYRINHAVLSRAKEDMIVMHPLPRVNGKFQRYCLKVLFETILAHRN